MSIKLPSSTLRYLVLFICSEEPSYGYRVVSRIEELSGGRWSPSSGTVYPLIDRLKDEDLLRELTEEETEERELEGEDRNYFIITEKGREELQEVVDNKEEHQDEFKDLIIGYLNIYGKTYGEGSVEKLFNEVKDSESFETSCEDSA
jgi:DNA-binding PadR family transcriptional regulator